MKYIIGILLFSISISLSAVPDSNFFTERACLSEAIYRESRGEKYLGQLAVGMVILNRVKHKDYPSTICGVIHQKGQFQWIKKVKILKATEKHILLADRIMKGEHELASFKATHFHAKYVHPKWKNVKYVVTIGNHTFYKQNERQH